MSLNLLLAAGLGRNSALLNRCALLKASAGTRLDLLRLRLMECPSHWQQERNWLPEESYVEIDEYNSVLAQGDKVLVVKGQLTGSTGVLCREAAMGSSRFLDVRIKSQAFPHSLCSCGGKAKAEGRLRQQISQILDERDSDGCEKINLRLSALVVLCIKLRPDSFGSFNREMTLNALMASLLEGGMLARQGGAGREQRKTIKDLACSMILEHNEKGAVFASNAFELDRSELASFDVRETFHPQFRVRAFPDRAIKI